VYCPWECAIENNKMKSDSTKLDVKQSLQIVRNSSQKCVDIQENEEESICKNNKVRIYE
jgi:hypothetical protein